MRKTCGSRRPPAPLLFLTKDLCDWVFRFIEPIPVNDAEFARLLLVFARRGRDGASWDSLVRAYREEWSAFLKEDKPRRVKPKKSKTRPRRRPRRRDA